MNYQDYLHLINNPNTNESDVQKFFELHTEFIPMPFLLNHHLHFNVVISKFDLGEGHITDFAYLTKSSDFWYLVLIELESPKKKIFLKGKEEIRFSSSFHNACDQIENWRSYIRSKPRIIEEKIKHLKVPLTDTPVHVKYVLIYGKNAEKENNIRRQSLFSEKSNDQCRIMTYDSVLSHLQNSQHIKKNILTQWREGFSLKALYNNNTNLFAYLSNDILKINNKQKKSLLQDQFEIDKWEQGELLICNGKSADFSTLSSKRKRI